MSTPIRFPIVLLLLPILFASVALAAPDPVRERPLVPTPPGGGPGINYAPEDQILPQGPGRETGEGIFDYEKARQAAAEDAVAEALAEGDIGGDDILIQSEDYSNYTSVDVAEDGDIYVALGLGDGSSVLRQVKVFRSQDGGDSWQDWGELSHATYGYYTPEIIVAEGVADRCFIAYTKMDDGPHKICVAGCDLSLPVGDFSTEIVVMENPGFAFYAPDINSDAANWGSYYLYLVGIGNNSPGNDVWFARSIDQGATFESAYAIATLGTSDPDYVVPTVAYGFGGYVHVAWHITSTGDLFDRALRYRRAATYANGGLSAWDPINYLTSTGNGIHEEYAQIDASKTDNQVVIAYRRYELGVSTDLGFLGSNDQGANFTVSHYTSGNMTWLDDFEWQPSTGNWIATGIDNPSVSLVRSAGSDITTWSSSEHFGIGYGSGVLNTARLALDPSRDYRCAFAWEKSHTHPVPDDLMFDAEWRRDPGYPNLEEGFPLDLAHSPASEPAVVDLDGDNDLEIVFGDTGGMIQAFHHDGTVVDGWPVQVPGSLSDGPVAIGDMRGNGDMLVLVGTTGGLVYAFESTGSPVPGWPFDTYQSAHAFVSIGALGGPYVRMAAVCAGERLYFLNHHGDMHHNFYFSWPGKSFQTPVAIGDVDGDGISEAVGAVSDWVFAVHATEATGVFSTSVPSFVSDAVTLGDLDLDGDVEVIVPTEGGELYAYQGDGSLMTGAWPFVSPTGFSLSSAAIGQMLGMSEPEMVVAAVNANVHLVWHHGGEGSGYPVETAGWNIYGAPIIGAVEEPISPDAVIGARGTRGWAWSNFGALIPGWPKWFDDNIYQAPAMGDLDLDGSNEIVFLTEGQLIVVDVNQVPSSASKTWAMYGHDPQRTGCSDCPEDLVTGIGDNDPGVETTGITRVSFAPPSPNPISGQATFSFALPVRAQVRLEIFDVRGARVATVFRQEVAPGEHLIGWGGCDDTGRALAGGQYLARLRVRGPGVDNELVRKVTILK